MQLISEGKAPKIVQPTEGATYDKIWKKKAVAKVNFTIRLLSTNTQLTKHICFTFMTSLVDGFEVSFHKNLLY